MQRKTIEKILSTKLKDWLSSIEKTDKELALDLKDNILLSGGSILSLFLQKEVNDYDIYINDMDVLLRLTNHYIKAYENSIRVLDGRLHHSYYDEIHPMYIDHMNGTKVDYDNEEELKEANKGAFACAVRNLKPDQIKLFFHSKDGGNTISKVLKKDYEKKKKENKDLKYFPIFFSPNAITLSDKIQIVLRFHGDNEAIHKTFDFIHATNYFTFKEGLVTNTRALESIITKQLFYQGSLYPLTSIIRMKKFINRGWSISAGEILKILYQVSVLNLNDPDVLEEQLIGVDIAYFGALIELIREGQTEMSSEYLNNLIDRVFNDDFEPITLENEHVISIPNNETN